MHAMLSPSRCPLAWSDNVPRKTYRPRSAGICHLYTPPLKQRSSVHPGSDAAAEREAMEDQLNAYEAGIADVLEAYQGAAAAHAAAAGASWPVDALVAGSTTPFLTR